jgi:hypothetical protein
MLAAGRVFPRAASKPALQQRSANQDKQAQIENSGPLQPAPELCPERQKSPAGMAGQAGAGLGAAYIMISLTDGGSDSA